MLRLTPKAIILVACLTIFSLRSTHAQISPPGLGAAKTAFWLALGVKRKLDSLGRKESVSYFGLGRKSDPDQLNLFGNQAILVLNHEIYHNFAPHQQYSYAISYRRQNNYEDHAPYQSEGIEQEFRLYGRYAYTLNLASRWKWKNTLRQEFRKFFTADFGRTDENFQFRTRLKTQLIYSFPGKNKKALALSTEGLFAISKYHGKEQDWSGYAYKEARFGLYYLFQIPHSPLSMDIGYVNDQIRGYDAAKWGVHYLALDVIWNIPYRH